MPDPSIDSALEQGRASYERRAWRDALESFELAEHLGRLGREDLERLAWSAALCGRDDAFLGALERLHHDCVEAGDPRAAARFAFWLGFHLTSLGSAAAPGWIARANRLVAHEEEPCAERGYLLLVEVHRHLQAQDAVLAGASAHEAARIGEACRDRDLVALARNLEGRALLRQGHAGAGLALLDEVMLSVTSGELSALVAGIVYCNAIVCCQQVYALERAREWTTALARWCERQPQLVTFSGLCLVHRVELMQLGGAWEQAREQIDQLCGGRVKGDPEVMGDACYRQGELARLRGDFAAAESAYRRALEHGREPQPGLALLRLAQGQTGAAASAIRRLRSTVSAAWQRPRVLAAFVEIMLAEGARDEARAGCEELEDTAAALGSEMVGAMAAQARGALALAEGDARAADAALRRALGSWTRLGAPYLAARVRVLLASAVLELGDREGASLEQEAARRVFQALGAETDVATLGGVSAPGGHGLSKRELEVVRLLARGLTNKAIARSLALSERTIDRHVSNIFLKLGVATRAAATAFAFQNRLV